MTQSEFYQFQIWVSASLTLGDLATVRALPPTTLAIFSYNLRKENYSGIHILASSEKHTSFVLVS